MRYPNFIKFQWEDGLPKPIIPANEYEFLSYLLITYRDAYTIEKMAFGDAINPVLQGKELVGYLQVDTVVAVEIRKDETIFKDWNSDEVVLTIPTTDLQQVFTEWLSFVSNPPTVSA